MRTMDTVKTMLTALGRDPMPSDSELQDLGLSRSDYEAVIKSPPGTRERMAFMAERFGISEAQLKQEHWRAVEMARACAKCGVMRNCERFRQGKNPGFDPANCPNAAHFSELAI